MHLLNALTLEITNLIQEHTKGWIILPLTVDPNRRDDNKIYFATKYQPLDNDTSRGVDRFICYHTVPQTINYSEYFLDHAKPNPFTFILIKHPGHHHRVVALKLESKVRFIYYRAYGWGHTEDSSSGKHKCSWPRSDEAKEEGKTILRLMPIYKARKIHKRWHPVIDRLDLTHPDFDHISKLIIDTIKHSWQPFHIGSKREIDIDGMVLANTGRIFEVDSHNTPLTKTSE